MVVKIRWKLMLLLLAIALAPLLTASLVDRILTRKLAHKLAGESREILTEQACRRLRMLVDNYGRLLARDQKVLELSLAAQAQAVEQRLAGPPPAKAADVYFAEAYDTGQGAPETLAPSEKYFRYDPNGRRVPIPVSYDEQVTLVPAGADPEALADEIARLSTMPAIYRLLHNAAPNLMHWQYTALESGVFGSYPGHGGYPPDYDPRQRQWYLNAKKEAECSWQPPYIGVSTRAVMLALSMPVRGPDGEIAGVTAIDVPIESIFQELKLPQQWSAEEATLFVYPGCGADGVPEGKLAIVAEKNYRGVTKNWRETLHIQFLDSEAPEDLAALRADALNGNSGVRKMPYRGRDALWAYGGGGLMQPFPVVIVPYDRVIARAEQAERHVLDRTVQGLQITGAILLGVVLIVVLAAVYSSRTVTRPLDQLTEASMKLAGGDYEARVDIRTGDEFQTLGEIFNATGPQLAERERMKHSLALAMEIQQQLLPQSQPQFDGFDIAGRAVYCDETGGDYYDFIDLVELGPSKLGIAVGDVTGHGIGAALLMASARAVLRSHAARHGADLGKLFDDLNRHLVRDTGDGRFMTLFYGMLDSADRSLRWTSGGHDPALRLRRATGEIDELPNTGLPLGVLDAATYGSAGPVTIAPGDVILIGTDGIWEAQNGRREMFGKQRLRDLLQAGAESTAEQIHADVVRAVHEFRAGAPQADDVTLVVIKALA